MIPPLTPSSTSPAYYQDCRLYGEDRDHEAERQQLEGVRHQEEQVARRDWTTTAQISSTKTVLNQVMRLTSGNGLSRGIQQFQALDILATVIVS
jgi:hypothetical protein